MQDYFTDKGKTDILRSTCTGLWEIILRQGREPVMHADSVMLELLGLDAAPEPEECYQVWYNRIQDEYKGSCAGDSVQGDCQYPGRGAGGPV